MGVSVRSVCQGSGTAGAGLSRSLRCLPCPQSRCELRAKGVRCRGIAKQAGGPGKSQKADILRGGWEEACLGEDHSPGFGGRECKKLVFAKTTPCILGRGSVKGLFLQKPLPSFGEVGVETAKNCKIHSQVFPRREWKS